MSYLVINDSCDANKSSLTFLQRNCFFSAIGDRGFDSIFIKFGTQIGPMFHMENIEKGCHVSRLNLSLK